MWIKRLARSSVLIAMLLLAACGRADPTPTLACTELLGPPMIGPTRPSPAPLIKTDLPAEPSPAPSPRVPAPEGPLAVRLVLVADGFTGPVDLAAPDDGSGRLLIADLVGRIWVVTREGERLERPFLDITDRMVALNPGYDERGLLGMALHPDYANNGRFFVYYSARLRPDAPAGWDHTSHLSEFHVSVDPNVGDAASERVILQIDQPQSNHNGGQIAFGPDGYLYVALGDGGGANDVGPGHPPQGHGQDIATLLGSILRIDVDGGRPYAVPGDNPFVGQEGRDEIYAYGLRNPFRFSFDAAGEWGLIAADVGQNLYEEVNRIERGGNYGWNIMEATHCFSPQSARTPPEECPQVGAHGEPLLLPILEYAHPGMSDGYGVSVTGGFVYRGQAVPRLQGLYVFGDWSGSLTAERPTLLAGIPPASEGEAWRREEILVQPPSGEGGREFLLSFGQDADLELYVLTTRNTGPSGNTGAVYRIVAADAEG